MKNIIITGTCRSGKSLLAIKLSKLLKNYSYYSVDNLRNALKETFNKDYEHLFFDEVQRYSYNVYLEMCWLNKDDLYFIFEGTIYDESELLAHYNNDSNIIIYVGKPCLSVNEYFKSIRSNEILYPSWTSSLTDDELLKLCEYYVDDSKRYKEICEKNNWYYLDTSYDYINKINNFAEDISNIIKNR